MRYFAVALFLMGMAAQANDQPEPDPNQVYLAKLTAAAAKGDSASQVCLGALYASGIAGSRDFGKAFESYKAAADHGDLEGKRRVGQMYHYGLGVKQDMAKAHAIFSALSDQGYTPADLDLSLMYNDGDGVTKNRKLALDLLEKAAQAGDYDAQTRLAIKYHFGDEDLSKDPTLSKQWLEKAVNHKIDCMADYGSIIPFIVDANLVQPESHVMTTAGRVGIRFIYKDQKATNIELMESSGSTEIDAAWTAAVQATKFPIWPQSYEIHEKMMGFWIGDDDLGPPSSFITAIRTAVRDAAVLPKHVLIYGSKGNGEPEVSFEYLDGKVSSIKIVKSSNDKETDAAAIAAVKAAHYPVTPKDYKGKKMSLSIIVNFGTFEPANSPATNTAPALTTVPR